MLHSKNYTRFAMIVLMLVLCLALPGCIEISLNNDSGQSSKSSDSGQNSSSDKNSKSTDSSQDHPQKNNSDSSSQDRGKTEKGSIAWNSGTYTGDLVNGQPNGQGKWTGTGSDPGVNNYCEGEWLDGALNGKGYASWPDGAYYDGLFENGFRNGSGVFVWASGDRYEGEFDSDHLNGNGIYWWIDGTYYQGQFVNDIQSGRGTKYWNDGSVEDGEFRNGELYNGWVKLPQDESYQVVNGIAQH